MPAPTLRRRLLTADGVAISAAYDEARAEPEAATGFVVAHGFTGSWSRPDSRRVAATLSGYGGVVSVDLRGHGASTGRSTVGDAEVHDVDAAVQYARWLGHRAVVTIGFSMGGSVVLRQGALASGRWRPDAVVAVSSAGYWFYQGTTPMRRLHRAVYSRAGRAVLRGGLGTRVTPVAWTEPYPLSPSEAAGLLAPTPLLVVHGGRDAYFPANHAEAVVTAARSGAARRGVDDATTYWLEPEFAHAESAATPALLSRIGAWAVASQRRAPTLTTESGERR